jgi:hypothetical protein
MIDYNQKALEPIAQEVAESHNLNTNDLVQYLDWQILEEEYYAYWNSAKDLFKNRLDHYDDVRDEFDAACDQAKAEISLDLLDSEKTDKETEMDRKTFDDHVKVLTDIYMKARIESILMQGKQIAPQNAIYGDDSFSLLVEAALLKATNQQYVVRKITDPMDKKIVESFDQSTPLKKALSYVYHLSNNFYVEPNEEQYFTGEKLFWGIKNEAIRKDEDASAEAIFKADLRAFLVFIIHKESFRCAERNSLEEKSNKNKDGFISESAELSAFYQRRDADADAIIDRLVPIFQRYIKNDKFVNLIDAASEIEQLGDDAVTLLTESILGYEYERNGEKYLQMGTGELMLNQQLYVQVQPYDRYAGYDYDKGEAKPSQQVTKYRFDLAIRMRDSCRKIDPGFEENPRFANVMRAFGVIADYVIPKEAREGLAEYAQEIATVRAKDGETAAIQRIENDLAEAKGAR